MRLVTCRRALLLALLTTVLVPAAAPAKAPARTFGVYADPWHLDDWRAARIAPQYVGRFEAF